MDSQISKDQFAAQQCSYTLTSAIVDNIKDIKMLFCGKKWWTSLDLLQELSYRQVCNIRRT